MPVGSLIAIPALPIAPQEIEYVYAPRLVGESTSDFTGVQQFTNWGPAPWEIAITMPPMRQSVASAWLTFIDDLQGITNYFTLGSAFLANYPELNGRNWRLKQQPSMRIPKDRFYRFVLDCREAL